MKRLDIREGLQNKHAIEFISIEIEKGASPTSFISVLTRVHKE